MNSRRKTRGHVDLLLNGAGELVANDTGKAEIPNGFPAPVFTDLLEVNSSLQGSQVLENSGKVRNREGGGGSG